MAADAPRPNSAPVARALTKVVVYYVLLFGIGLLIWDSLPRTGGFTESFDLLSGTAAPVAASKTAPPPSIGEVNLSLTVALAMISAILLSIPVAWVYVLTRAKRGYQQSVVHLLIVLPLVVSGIVVLVQYSLALAFSLAGIVAAMFTLGLASGMSRRQVSDSIAGSLPPIAALLSNDAVANAASRAQLDGLLALWQPPLTD